ncbi:LRR receptor-like serine/threonine-protein kinase FLS2 [Hordeum vulgare]|nr:LRR receptor-like serine/threonine-protein kinase FLS2 [Hordeum vulgare]
MVVHHLKTLTRVSLGEGREMEAVDGLMRGLRLTEDERRGVKVRVPGKERGKTPVAQAVGKVMSEKLAHPDAIQLSLGRVWCPIKGIECKEVGENLFVFTFHQESGERRALEDGPWMFEKDLVVVEDYDRGRGRRTMSSMLSPSG